MNGSRELFSVLPGYCLGWEQHRRALEDDMVTWARAVLAVAPTLSERREQFGSCFGVEFNACITDCAENVPGWCMQLAGSTAVIPCGAELICPRAGNSCCAVSGH